MLARITIEPKAEKVEANAALSDLFRAALQNSGILQAGTLREQLFAYVGETFPNSSYIEKTNIVTNLETDLIHDVVDWKTFIIGMTVLNQTIEITATPKTE